MDTKLKIQHIYFILYTDTDTWNFYTDSNIFSVPLNHNKIEV